GKQKTVVTHPSFQPPKTHQADKFFFALHFRKVLLNTYLLHFLEDPFSISPLVLQESAFFFLRVLR
ncbi:hypothetical protein PSY31_23510, partial [Shigella flexneri]|nr:hypothetical protein [Shigella flexneri]